MRRITIEPEEKRAGHAAFAALSRAAKPDPWPRPKIGFRHRPTAIDRVAGGVALVTAGGAALFILWASAFPIAL